MLCFSFFGDVAQRILLCEETIRYSAFRSHGVNIGVTLVIVPGKPNDGHLYAIHRRALEKVRLASVDDWSPKAPGFPYSYLFARIAEDRLMDSGCGMYTLRIRPGDRLRTVPVRLACGGEPSALTIENVLSGPSDLLDFVPFTCLKIGPLPRDEQAHLLRFECHIGGSSYSDLIPEDAESGLRIYQVYGPSHIRRHIVTVDVPRAAAATNSDAFAKHVALLSHLEKRKHLIHPATYSIVAVDNPNCNPARLKPLTLTKDLQCLTHLISPAVYDHQVLKMIPGRLHWFTCDYPSDNFFLQLIGPMALSEVREHVSSLSYAGV